MIVPVVVALAVLTIAVTGAAAPLVRGPSPVVEPVVSPAHERRRALLLEIDDLDAALAEGSIEPADHSTARATIERRLAALDARIRGATAPARVALEGRGGRLATALIVVAVTAVVAIPALLGAAGTRAPGEAITGTIPTAVPVASGAQTLDDLRAAVERAPNDIAARLALGRAEFGRGDLGSASTQYLAVLRIDPTNAEALARLGLMLGLSGRPRQGLGAIDRAIALDPGFHEARLFRAVLELRVLDRPEAALADARAYLDAAGADAPAAEIRTARRVTERAAAVSRVEASGT